MTAIPQIDVEPVLLELVKLKIVLSETLLPDVDVANLIPLQA